MKKIDYIEIYVSNLLCSVQYYKSTFQFIPVAFLEEADRSSVLIQHGAIRLVLTASKNPVDDISQFIHIHGDGVKNIAFLTTNVEEQFDLAVKHGHKAILEPTAYKTGGQIICKATVSAFGDISHTFIQRQSDRDYRLPFFEFISDSRPVKTSVLNQIDHIAVCVNQGDITYWVKDYIDTYGFSQSHEEYVVTANSGMNSTVVQSHDGQIKIVFVEPIPGTRPSQVSAYLKSFGGPGVQHIAFSTEDIVSAVKLFRDRGLDMLSIPDSYYDIQKNRFHISENDLNILREYSILIDKCDPGFLYQIFSKPVVSRPTLFFEIIQRIGCDGFGSGNIKALFQAIEQEQIIRETANL